MTSMSVLAKWLLRLSGSATCLACLAIFLPNEWMGSIHYRLGLGELPSGRIVEYMARTLSAMYFAHGLMVLAISTQLPQCWSLVGIVGMVNVMLGTVFLVVDLKCAMPWYWTLGEGPPIATLGGALVWVWLKGRIDNSAGPLK